jgi:6-phosphogluconolactonase (cycloisomerase 2 family)
MTTLVSPLLIDTSGNISFTGNVSGGNLTTSGSVLSNRFIETPYQVVAPQSVVTQGSGQLASPVPSNLSFGASGMVVATCDPTGRFLYAISQNTTPNRIYAFTINQATGYTTVIGSYTAVTGATSCNGLKVTPSGKFLYVIANDTSLIYMYSIDQSTGALTALSTPSISTGTTTAATPLDIVIDPTGRFVYTINLGTATNGTVSMFSIDQTTGILTSITTPIAAGLYPQSLSVDPTGRFLYTSNYGSPTNVLLFYINQSTGALTQISSVSSIQYPVVIVDPTGRFLYVAGGPNIGSGGFISMYSINQTTGALTSIASDLTVTQTIQSLAIDPTGSFLYGVSPATSGTNWMWSINQKTGVLIPIGTGTFAQGGYCSGITIHPSGRYLYLPQASLTYVVAVNINNFSAGVGTFAGSVTTTGIVSGNSNVTMTSNANITMYVAGNTTARFTATSTGIVANGTMSVSGNVTGANFTGALANGNSNVNIATANGNVTIAAVGNTTMTITGTGANVAGTLSASGNITTAGILTIPFGPSNQATDVNLIALSQSLIA